MKDLGTIFQLLRNILDTIVYLVASKEDLEKVPLCEFPDQVGTML